MILLDTNVASEVMKDFSDPKVKAWLAVQTPDQCFLSSITEAELKFGVELLPAGQRKEHLRRAVDETIGIDFSGRILPFDSAAATEYASILAHRRRLGRPIGQLDAMIAAIARSTGAVLATRNVRDFNECGLVIVNPWGT